MDWSTARTEGLRVTRNRVLSCHGELDKWSLHGECTDI